MTLNSKQSLNKQLANFHKCSNFLLLQTKCTYTKTPTLLPNFIPKLYKKVNFQKTIDKQNNKLQKTILLTKFVKTKTTIL